MSKVNKKSKTTQELNLVKLSSEHLPIDKDLIAELEKSVKELEAVDQKNLNLSATQLMLLNQKELNFIQLTKALEKFLEIKKKESHAEYKKFLATEKLFKEAIKKVSIEKLLKKIANGKGLTLTGYKRKTSLKYKIDITKFKINPKYIDYFKFNEKKFVKDIMEGKLKTNILKEDEIIITQEY